MKPLNTSRSETSYGGVLQPLVEVLAKSPRQKDRLIGQEVVIPDKNIKAIVALDGSDNIHLLISPSPCDDSRLSKIELRGLKISNKDWSVAGLKAQNYLDISCSTGTLPSFKRPFLRFAEDVLYEVSQLKTAPVDAVYRTCVRWRRFWSPDSSGEITPEWVHGLFGELLFLSDSIERFGQDVVSNWAGPLGSDHDFQTGTDLAVEVKTSIEIPFRIHCNIRQLDSSLFKKLFIVCYRLTPSENGSSLPDLVRYIETCLEHNGSMLDRFYERLSAAGYLRLQEPVYSESTFNSSKAVAFQVNDSFPKIVEKSFLTAPDHRISNIRYTLQLTGINELALETIEGSLKILGKS